MRLCLATDHLVDWLVAYLAQQVPQRKVYGGYGSYGETLAAAVEDGSAEFANGRLSVWQTGEPNVPTVLRFRTHSRPVHLIPHLVDVSRVLSNDETRKVLLDEPTRGLSTKTEDGTAYISNLALASDPV